MNFAEESAGVPTPHAGQELVLNLPGRYRVAVCGRRFGKTVAAAIAAVRRCERADRSQRIWWISPIQSQSNRVEREVAEWVRQRGRGRSESLVSLESPGRPKSARKEKTPKTPETPSWLHRKSEHALIHLPSVSRIEFRSAHAADHLRGAGLDMVIIDEAADISDQAWKMIIKPMLLDGQGEAYILGTPRGTRHWLHRVFVLGQNRTGAYASVRLPTRANPRLEAAEIDAYRAEMTDEEFRQEFEAEFIDGVNAVFSKVRESVDGPPLNIGARGASYVTGIDLGQALNFTVLCSINCHTQRVEGFARFNKLDWEQQTAKILAHLDAFPGPAVVDATGVGASVHEQLARRGRFPIEGFTFTTTSRQEILGALSVAFSYGKIRLAEIPDLIAELQSFTLLEQRDPTGATRSRYGVPHGQHDDCVMALALAWWGLKARNLWSLGSGNPLRDGLYG